MLNPCLGEPMTGTRRLAAIMAIDVVGYSRLMSEDETGTANAVREHRDAARPIVAGLGGRIVKTMGDGLLLEFPSVVAAVESAVAIQKLMAERNAGVPEAKRIVYRIGVNLGDVLIDGDDILGEGVNIAARLEAICQPGGVLISSTAHEHVRGKIGSQFTDLGEKSLKNIARPVRVHALTSPAAGSAPITPTMPIGAPRLSLIVLPFTNIGGDAEQEYFVDGVTESLTTDLSRIRGSFVIARNTAFTYKGKAVDLKQVGRELNIRYVLEGSVQRGGQRMRVNVQLIDAESGKHLWAERFEKPLTDLFDMQDEIVARLANALDARLQSAEARRAEEKPNPDSTDLYFLGRASLNKGATPGYVAEALRFFERALLLDPTNVDCLVGSAVVEATVAANFTPNDLKARFVRAEEALKRALSLAPNHALAHMLLGFVLMHTNRAPQSLAEYERAIELDRNLAMAHALMGSAKYFLGRAEETAAHVSVAEQLSPGDPYRYVMAHIAGIAKFHLGNEEEAVAWLRRSLELNRNYPTTHFFLAAALARLGCLEEAKSHVQIGLSMNSKYNVSSYRANPQSDNPIFVAGKARLIEGLLMAGVPE
jgi:TolB-like protein/class 3 adenylate cyclase/Flp pilus assembly protein TadD